jgi:hypothetical protein
MTDALDLLPLRATVREAADEPDRVLRVQLLCLQRPYSRRPSQRAVVVVDPDNHSSYSAP